MAYDELFLDIKTVLATDRKVRQAIMDRLLRDFSAAWGVTNPENGGLVRDDIIPESYAQACIQAMQGKRKHPVTGRWVKETNYVQVPDTSFQLGKDENGYVIHELAIEGTETPLNDGHGHVLLDSHGNVLTRNTKDVKILLQMAKTHLQEYKDNDNGHTSNVVNVNVGTMVNNPMYVGIDLHGWNLDDVHDLIAVVKRGESHKQLQAQHEHSQTTIIDSQ